MFLGFVAPVLWYAAGLLAIGYITAQVNAVITHIYTQKLRYCHELAKGLDEVQAIAPRENVFEHTAV